jgi:uncharacterized protein DUF998
MRVTKTLLACGVVAGPRYVLVSLTEALTRDGFDLARHQWSLLSNGDLGWIHIANLVVTGLVTVAFAVGLRHALRPGRGGTWAARGGSVGTAEKRVPFERRRRRSWPTGCRRCSRSSTSSSTRLLGDRRRPLDAAGALRGRASPRPDPGRPDAPGTRGARPPDPDGDPGLTRPRPDRPVRSGHPAPPSCRPCAATSSPSSVVSTRHGKRSNAPRPSRETKASAPCSWTTPPPVTGDPPRSDGAS